MNNIVQISANTTPVVINETGDALPYLTLPAGWGAVENSTPALRPQNGPNALPRQTLRL